MSQNILSKKRWNVWNESAKAKVRADEKAHAEKEAKKARAVAAVEAEARLAALKKTAIPSLQLCGAPAAAALEDGGVGDWREQLALRAFGVEDPGPTAPNAEHEAERKVEDLKEKKKRGFDPWKLGDGAAETQAHKPWYHYKDSTEAPMRDRWGVAKVGVDADQLAVRDERRKLMADPAAVVFKALTLKTGKAPTSMEAPSLVPVSRGEGGTRFIAGVAARPHLAAGSSSSESDTSSDSDSKHARKRRRHKKKRKESRKGSRTKKPKKSKKKKGDKDREKAASLAALREARLRREAAEARREGRLFVDSAEALSTQDAGRTVPAYSSQFNPSLARQNRR